MSRTLLVLLIALVMAACSGPGGANTTSTTVEAINTTTTTMAITTTMADLRTCPPAPYEVGVLPVTVSGSDFDPSEAEPDVWTSVGGTHTTFFGFTDGTMAIALIRGTLPAVEWPGPKGETNVDGVPAVVGPHPDGTWVMGWYVEPAERCDLYTMVFYPPWNPDDVEKAILSMTRIPG